MQMGSVIVKPHERGHISYLLSAEKVPLFCDSPRHRTWLYTVSVYQRAWGFLGAQPVPGLGQGLYFRGLCPLSRGFSHGYWGHPWLQAPPWKTPFQWISRTVQASETTLPVMSWNTLSAGFKRMKRRLHLKKKTSLMLLFKGWYNTKSLRKN